MFSPSIEEIVKKSISLASPSVLELLSKDELVWGPRWVNIAVMAGLNNTIFEVIGTKQEWQKDWGPKTDFRAIAYQKADLVRRTGKSTAHIVNLYPWQLAKDDFPWAGGVGNRYLSVGVSGAREETDEMIAYTILCMIQGICKLYMKEIKNKLSD